MNGAGVGWRGEELAFRIVAGDDRRRQPVEAHVRHVYDRAYGATIRSFPDTLIAEFDAAETVRSAAGLRFAKDGFFSQCYLDKRLEDVLGRIAEEPVPRDRIIEVVNLASTGVCSSVHLIENIIEFGRRNGAEWAVFTITPRLHKLLRRINLPIVVLASAQRSRVPNPEDWGRYYETLPVVAAMRDREPGSTVLSSNLDHRARPDAVRRGVGSPLVHAHG